jgi:hypothetical protein
MLSIIMLSVFMLSVLVLNVIMLSVVRLNGIMLSVVAPVCVTKFFLNLHKIYKFIVMVSRLVGHSLHNLFIL